MATESDDACTLEHLAKVVMVVPDEDGNYCTDNRMDEVYPGIFLGDRMAALDLDFLKGNGVTHVLNSCQGKDPWVSVNTTKDTYAKVGMQFFGFAGEDTVEFPLSEWFQQSSNFIQSALDSKGKVLVHCYHGCSRSATLVLAFLMLKRRLRASEAARTVKERRDILPNEGFLRQLCELDRKLLKAGHYKKTP